MSSTKRRDRLIYNIHRGKIVTTSFQEITLVLNKSTLVPHPKTFELIEIANKTIIQRKLGCVADIGTGSGIIAISMAKRFPDMRVLASDTNQSALSTASNNALINKVTNIKFILNTDGVWLSEYKHAQVDMIVSNPPFVGEDEYNSFMFRSNYPYALIESKHAILTPGDKEGLSPFINIVTNSTNLKTRFILFQCNPDNINKLVGVLNRSQKTKTQVINDKDGTKRFLLIERI